MVSTRTFRVLTAVSGIGGQVALGVYYSGLLIPGRLATGTASSTHLVELASQHHAAILLDAWLQGVGATGSVVFFLALVQLSGADRRFAGRLTIVGSSVLLAVAFADVTFAVAAAQAAKIGHDQTALVAYDFIAGPGEAFDYAFLFVPAPLLMLSVGTVVLGSRILPRAFGVLAVVLGIGLVGLGIASLVNPLAGPTGAAFEILEAMQGLWVLASAISLLVLPEQRA